MKIESLLLKTAPFLPVLLFIWMCLALYLFIWMCLALYLPLFPTELLISAAKLGNPKVGHIILFGGWTFLFGLTMMVFFEKPGISLILVVIAGILFGALVEGLQYLMPHGRTGSLADVGFNTIGAVAAGAVLFVLRKNVIADFQRKISSHN